MPEPSFAAGDPLISVVVCSYTTARLPDIQQLLLALQQQTYGRLETVFVSDGSPELLEHVAGFVSAQGLAGVQAVLNDERPGLAASRNAGVGQASGDIIAFIDDDALPFAGWGRSIAAAMAAEDVAGVTGPAFPLWEDESLAWLPEEFFWLVSCPTPGWLGRDQVTDVRNAWGMNMAFKADVFRTCRFPEELGYRHGAASAPSHLLGEDTAFSVLVRQRTGKRIIFDPAVQVRHKVYRHRLTPLSVRRRAFWEGYTKATMRRLARSDIWTGLDLAPERDQIWRIAGGFLPRTVAGLAREPSTSWRQLRLAADALSHAALGYAAGTVPGLGRLVCKRFSP